MIKTRRALRVKASCYYYDSEAGEWIIICSSCRRLIGYAPTIKIARRSRLSHTRTECLGGY
jgi:hypothetical protein